MFKNILLLVLLSSLSVKSAEIPSVSTRRTDGDVIRAGQFLFDVSIRAQIIVDGDMAFAVHICSGVLLNEYWVLTAASCSTTRPLKDIWILLGDQVKQTETRSSYQIEKIIVHPRYRNLGYYRRDNIALMKSAERIGFNAQIKPIALSNTKEVENVGAQVSGRDGQLFETFYYINVTTLTNPNCRSQLRLLQKPLLNKKIVCAINADGGGLCDEEINAGSGLVSLDDGKLIGIASWTVSCETGIPDGYARIPPYLEWISTITGIVYN